MKFTGYINTFLDSLSTDIGIDLGTSAVKLLLMALYSMSQLLLRSIRRPANWWQ